MKKALLVWALFAQFACADVSKAFLNLSNTSIIEGAYVGEGGEPSKQRADYELLLKAKDPGALFAKLFDEAKTNEAKVYALLGLYESDKKAYRAALKTLNTDNQSIELIEGCIVGSYTLKWAIQAIENGKLKYIVSH
ncbi:MAG: hypothetical protein LBQ18_08420 [Campylobacteraceae bacterium]|jgi:hypothetical protein|nr:hypothetical protein [Campylobacteraceae bacterium]